MGILKVFGIGHIFTDDGKKVRPSPLVEEGLRVMYLI